MEIKDINEDLNDHVKQAVDYVFDLESSVDKVILVNGNEFRYYKCDVVNRKFSRVFVWFRNNLSDTKTQDKIFSIIGKKSLEDDLKQYSLNDWNLKTFLDKFNSWKILLFKSLSVQIREKFENDEQFKQKLRNWIGYRPELSLSWTWQEERYKKSIRDFCSEALIKELGKGYRVTKSLDSNFWKNYKKDEKYKQKVINTLRNAGISVDIFDKFALEAAYLFLNRILFLRMAEDYGFLPFKIFSPSWIINFYKFNREKSIYHQLSSCLSEIDFHFPIIYKYPLFDNIYFEELSWSKAIIIKIIEEIILFDFSTSDKDLIGKIYEGSIDKNTRKILGQFYTDPIIVRYIIEKLENIDEDKEILDPACGSGTFLKEYYNKVENLMKKKGYSEDDIPEKLKNKIWGFDIDPFAVQLTTIKLIIQNFKKAPKERRIYNINSLVNKLDETYIERLNINNDILAKNFDYIIGNPPFFVVNTTEQPYKNILKTGNYDRIKDQNLNIVSMFLYKYLQKLNKEGQLAFIFPRSLLHVSSFTNIRRNILKKEVQYIYDLGRAFEDVGLQQIILIIKNNKPTNNAIHYGLLSMDYETGNVSELLDYTISQDYIINNIDCVFEVFSGEKNEESISGQKIKSKIINQAKGKNIGSYCVKIQRGLGYQKFSTSSRKNSDDLVIIGGRSIFNYGKKGIDTYKYIPRNKIIKGKMSSKESRNLYKPKIMLQNLFSSKIRIVGFYDNSPIKREKKFNITKNKQEEFNIYILTNDTITNLYVKEEKFARFLLAILTSELVTYYLRDFIFVRQTLTIHLDEKYLKKIPVIVPNENQLKLINQKVIELEKFVSDNQRKTPVSERNIPDWENPDDQRYPEYSKLLNDLNMEIYKLYGLTQAEINYIGKQLNEFDKFY